MPLISLSDMKRCAWKVKTIHFSCLFFFTTVDSPNKGEQDLYSQLKKIALDLSVSLHRFTYCLAVHSFISIIHSALMTQNEILSLVDTDLALRKIGLESLVVIGSVSMSFKTDFLNRVRMNTVQGFQIFSPIAFMMYPCNKLCTECESYDVSQANGYFDKFNVDVFISSDVNIENVQVILYDHNKWLHSESDYNETEDCIKCLSRLIREDFITNQPSNTKCNSRNLEPLMICLRPFFSFVNKVTKELTVAKHMTDWYHCLQNESNIKQKVCMIAFNVLAGLVIFIWLMYLGTPGQYFMQFTEFVVRNVRVLLNSLKGSPVGLKLNVELNNFFLNCFAYHVDLWATFLVIVSPIVQYLFIPLAIIGCLGLSFQLALLSDLLILISVHAHCFYIYAAVLYHIEIVGIAALWRVLRGKRNNILKNRIEAHDYSNPQLYLATMFFATLLFILPTVLVYYIVFASLRFCVYSVTYILDIIQRQILLFPTYNYLKWLSGSYVNHNNIEMSFVRSKLTKTKNATYPVSVIYIEPKRSMPSIRYSSKLKLNSDSLMSIDQFLLSLIRSDMLGFIHPKKRL